MLKLPTLLVLSLFFNPKGGICERYLSCVLQTAESLEGGQNQIDSCDVLGCCEIGN